MLHIGSLIRLWDQGCSFWNGINFFNIAIKVRRKSFTVRFLQVEASSECGRLCNDYWVYTDTYWVDNRIVTHICNVWRYNYNVRVIPCLPNDIVERFLQFLERTNITVLIIMKTRIDKNRCIGNYLCHTTNSSFNKTLFKTKHIHTYIWLIKYIYIYIYIDLINCTQT